MINMTLMESDKITLYEFATYKNIQKTTLKDYRIVIIHYTTYFNKTLTELIQEAETEEKNGVRWKNSKLKQRLVEFKKYLYNNFSPGTADNYFIKIKAIYKFKEIIIGELPKLNTKNLTKNIPLTFNDLPTPEILKEAVNQCNPLLRAYILFTCSSGCAVNEITNLINELIKATSKYHKQKDIHYVMNTLKNQTEVVPTWYLLRIKTNKYYTTFSSPESTQSIIDYLY